MVWYYSYIESFVTFFCFPHSSLVKVFPNWTAQPEWLSPLPGLPKDVLMYTYTLSNGSLPMNLFIPANVYRYSNSFKLLLIKWGSWLWCIRLELSIEYLTSHNCLGIVASNDGMKPLLVFQSLFITKLSFTTMFDRMICCLYCAWGCSIILAQELYSPRRATQVMPHMDSLMPIQTAYFILISEKLHMKFSLMALLPGLALHGLSLFDISDSAVVLSSTSALNVGSSLLSASYSS